MIDLIALVVALLALAISGLVALWEWHDRPRYLWRFNRQIEISGWKQVVPNEFVLAELEFGDAHGQHVTVFAEGSARAHNVAVTPVNCQYEMNDRDLKRPVMAHGSEPISVDVDVPNLDSGNSYVEVRWVQAFPARNMAWRIDLHTGELEQWRWRWRWSDFWPVRRSHAKWFDRRWARCTGSWRPLKRSPFAEIPTS